MIELNPSEFSLVTHLVADSNQQVIPLAICQGINPGRIFVDQIDNPKFVLIWTTVGYYFLFGEPFQNEDMASISQILTNIFVPASQSTGESSLIMIPSSPNWKTFLPVLLPDRKIIEIFRKPFLFDQDTFDKNKTSNATLPTGFQIQTMDLSTASKIGILASWSSFDKFSTDGIGLAIFKEEELACTCHSVFSSSEKVEIDVHTLEKFRGVGLAKFICTAMIEKCLQEGKYPNWECFWDNEPSINLATTLGFISQAEYPVFYWEE